MSRLSALQDLDPEGGGRAMIYTSHGLMTAADLEEYRQDYDWDELRESGSDDECELKQPAPVASPDGEVTTEAQEG
jgi:hypothetical protein